MRYFMIFILISIGVADIHAQVDDVKSSEFNNRLILDSDASSNKPNSGVDKFADGATHVELDLEYTRYFRIEGIGRFGVGARLARPWVERYPSLKLVRVQESWLEVPVYYCVGRTPEKNPAEDVIISVDLGLFLGALLSQQIHVQPGTQVPVNFVSNAEFLGYFKGGIGLEWSASLPINERQAVVTGLSIRGDLGTFGGSTDGTIRVENITIGVFFGAGF